MKVEFNNNNKDNEKDDVLEVFTSLIKYLKLADYNLKNNRNEIFKELEKESNEITIEEIEDGVKLILDKVYEWYDIYKSANDILQISLKEYDVVSKESAYILGECALVDKLYFEIIDFQIGCIGGMMCEKIKKGGIFCI